MSQAKKLGAFRQAIIDPEILERIPEGPLRDAAVKYLGG